tara:strand:+ start:1025 stop:1981 length:957 start_codon:yes stop_codon:yes gene_type:complete
MVICFGTRPEWLKVKSVYEAMPESKLLFTGQHEDLVQGVDPDLKMQIDKNGERLDSIVASCLLNFPDFEDDTVLVQGDTASAYGCALAAYHRKKKIVYLEAGLRSHSLGHPYPEEGYRQMISRISSINLCPTDLSKQNLENEDVLGECHVTGNTILDLLDKKGVTYGDDVVVTMHRRENLSKMKEWFAAIDEAARTTGLNFVFPCHPSVKHLSGMMNHVKVIDPLNHGDMINLIKGCRFVITDSGGLQEEGSFLEKKVVVCRETTERPEGIDSGHILMCASPDELTSVVSEVFNDYEIDSPCPFGDGQSSKKIKFILE